VPFAISIPILGLVQAAVVALPGRLPPLPLDGLRSRWWALAPVLSIVVAIGAVNFFEGSATVLTYLALVAVPPLAAIALGALVRGAAPAWALAVPLLFAVAWAASGALAGEAAATALSGLACVTLGWMLVSAVPAGWLRAGVYAMASVDAALVAADLLQGPNSVLTAAMPAAELPRLQVIHFGSAAMGFGDLFVAGVVGCLLLAEDLAAAAADPWSRRQWTGAALVAVLALCFDLLFFAVDTLPATVPVALALAAARATTAGRGHRGGS
jgi:hypothetical protein